MIVVVNIEGIIKLVQRKNEHTTFTNLPWTNHKTKPKEFEPKLWNTNDNTNEIKWLPSGKLRFKEIKLRKRNHNSRRPQYM
jgi:hypothetical protein